MGLFRKLVNQTRKPEGILGKMMIRGMNNGHAKISDWGMAHLQNITPEKIAELGCGGGRNISELLKKYPSAKVTGIDYSPLSVEKAMAYNKKWIEEKRCTIQQGDVSNLSLPKENFDLVTAFETIYFWPELEACFLQIANLLKPGGVFMIVNESDGTDAAGLKYEQMIDGMKCYIPSEIEKTLISAGFSTVETDHHASKPWITVLATK